MPDNDPTQPGTPSRELHGLDPGELFARGLHTVKPSAGTGPWQPPTPEELAALLPQYRIESLLGHGGMGAVYKGAQAALDRPVAIKLLPAELAADGDFIARFQREARTLAKLQHSGIVAVHDFGQTSAGHLYFVMEFVDGTDLQHILKGPGLKPAQAFELIAQICDALYYAHRQGVIHRDIKPANILLTKDGRAKVADFGLARPLTEDGGGMTATNMVMGTPDYMAPEQRTGDGHPDHRADIFALGVMLYEMLTGQRPHGAFQAPSKRVQVDVRIDEVVLKALQQEPDRRYQQASEMKTDVDHIRTTPPTPEKPRPAKALLAAKVLLSAAALLVAAFFLLKFLTPTRTTPAPMASVPADGKPLAASTPAPSAPPSPEQVGNAKKRLAEARAHLKAGDLPEARKLAETALTGAPGELAVQAEAALLLADAQAPERAAALAEEFVGHAEAEHPQFAAVSDLRVKLAPALKDYQGRLTAAVKLAAARDDAGELRELQAALEILPDGREARARLQQNPVQIGRPLSQRAWAGPLGHRFVPIEGLPNVLFSIWETRVKDFEAFVQETGHDMKEPRSEQEKSATWQQPGFAQTGDHPVVLVSREDASAFCHWLTQKERAAGRLLPGQVYRLPTDREWSAAMGVQNEPGDFPEDREFPQDVFTWEKGTQPPRNAENLNWTNDDFASTAPVGSGLANRFGIYDLLGNVMEICLDPWAFDDAKVSVRGSSFRADQNAGRNGFGYGKQVGDVAIGFRCVLDLKSEEQRRVQTALEAAVEKAHTRIPVGENHWGEIRTLVSDEMVLLDMTWWRYAEDEDLAIFANLPITHLFANGISFRKPAALQTMPLRVLNLGSLFVPEDFLTSLRGLPLEWVSLNQNYQSEMKIKSLEPLAGMKLKGLRLDSFKNLANVEPLRGMPLEVLRLVEFPNPVLDLQPLKDAPMRKVFLPDRTPLEALVQACEWWRGSLKTVEVVRYDWFAHLLRTEALTGDPARVTGLKSVLATKFAAVPLLKPWVAALNENRYQTLTEFSARAARLLGGDRTAFDGLVKTFNGHSYLMTPWSLTYDRAKELAQKFGGHLLTITTPEENDFVIQQAQSGYFRNNAWLGLDRTGKGRSGWIWVTGEPLNFQNWAPDSGDGFDAAQLVEQQGKWLWINDTKNAYHRVIIEWDTPTPQPPAAAR